MTVAGDNADVSEVQVAAILHKTSLIFHKTPLIFGAAHPTRTISSSRREG
jgi:hypothetical protein